MKLSTLLTGLAAVGALQLAGMPVEAEAQTATDAPPVEIHTLPVRDNVYMLVGDGGNVTVQVGEDGILVVDTGLARGSKQLLAAIRRISDKPIRFILNTHVHRDHTGGNAAISSAGASIFGGNVVGVVEGDVLGSQAKIFAHENVLKRLSQEEPVPPVAAWPTDTYFRDKKELFFNGEGVQMFYEPAAHTDGDSIVYFRRSDVISAGDVFTMNRFPVIDAARGGSVQGIIDALNHLVDLALPGPGQEGGTMIVPGHGRLCDEADLVEYRDMMVIVSDRVRDMIQHGMDLEAVRAARPTLGYDTEYGADTGFWTTAMFVDAVYQDLSGG